MEDEVIVQLPKLPLQYPFATVVAERGYGRSCGKIELIVKGKKM